MGFLQTVMLPSGTGGIFGGSEGINFGVQRGLGGESPPTREGVPENTTLQPVRVEEPVRDFWPNLEEPVRDF